MSNDRKPSEYIAWSPNWEAKQLEQLIERAKSYDRVTKGLLDSVSFREDPFPGIAKIRCLAEEVSISARGGIMTCVPKDESLLGKDGIVILEVCLDANQLIQAKRAFFFAFEEEFMTSPVAIVQLDGEVGLRGIILDPFAKSRKAATPHFKVGKIFSPFVFIEDGSAFDLFIGQNVLEITKNYKQKENILKRS